MNDKELRLECWKIATDCTKNYLFEDITSRLNCIQTLCVGLYDYFEHGIPTNFTNALNTISKKQTE